MQGYYELFGQYDGENFGEGNLNKTVVFHTLTVPWLVVANEFSLTAFQHSEIDQ